MDRSPAPFPHLFSPLRIGGLTLKNRIFSSGHDTVMAADGLVTDRLIAYHQARAAGGAGLIVLQVSGVHESARYTSHMLMATSDESITGYRRVAEAVHAHGCHLFAQLFHPGREIMESTDGARPVAWAPSAVPTDRFHVVPRAMPADLIADVVAGYAAAAARMHAAGVDGVEIVASHGYLPAQFLNPGTNLRTDAYGGDQDGRLRFLREVLATVRSATPAGFVIGVRISPDERSPEGLTPEVVHPALAALDGEGAFDYVSVVAGTSATAVGSDHIVPPMTMPNAYTAPLAAAVKAVVSVPVLVAGRINQPQEAEVVIASGQADACAMTRALICDPLLPARAAAGDLDGIRACVGCNQACIGHFHDGYPISCIQYPESGRELTYGTRRTATRQRTVLVVGGGPAGLKAAAVAAERGHLVTLIERDRRLGGQVRLAERLPGRAEFGGVVTNLTEEARRAGAEVITGTAVDAALVLTRAPDVVVLATGARPRMPLVEVEDGASVLHAWDVVAGAATPDGRIAVVDWRCDWVGLGTALLLAERGHRVTLCVDGYHAGQLLQQYVRDEMLAAAHRRRIEIVPTVRLYGVDADTAYLQHTLSGEPVILSDVAATVLAAGPEPDDALLADLADYQGEVHAIGDCAGPRTVEEAVLEGLRVGAAV